MDVLHCAASHGHWRFSRAKCLYRLPKRYTRLIVLLKTRGRGATAIIRTWVEMTDFPALTHAVRRLCRAPTNTSQGHTASGTRQALANDLGSRLVTQQAHCTSGAAADDVFVDCFPTGGKCKPQVPVTLCGHPHQPSVSLLLGMNNETRNNGNANSVADDEGHRRQHARHHNTLLRRTTPPSFTQLARVCACVCALPSSSSPPSQSSAWSSAAPSSPPPRLPKHVKHVVVVVFRLAVGRCGVAAGRPFCVSRDLL
jgi:hypothetical protein